jgi:phosphoglycerate dehydrogenase-like enzyme
MTADSALVAVFPHVEDGIVEAIRRGGGDVVELVDANALVWTDPFQPADLGDALEGSQVRWVQLPFAGIEAFFAAGVIDPSRTWTCTKGVYGHATAEHALASILMAARRLHLHAQASTWAPAPGGREERSLKDLTVVIVGTGGIGTALAKMLGPLQARIIGVNRSGRALDGAALTVKTSSLHDVLPDADFVAIAAAHTPETHHLIDAEALKRMRSDAWLVNVARGGLVDTDALVSALRADEVGGAVLDVTDPEPLPDGHPLWELENAVITPHVANTWAMGLPELRSMVERNVRRFAAGEQLEGLVDPGAGY